MKARVAALMWGKATVNKKDICRNGDISSSSKYTPTEQFSAQSKDGREARQGGVQSYLGKTDR